VGLTFAVQSIEGMYHADFAQRDFLFHVFPRQWPIQAANAVSCMVRTVDLRSAAFFHPQQRGKRMSPKATILIVDDREPTAGIDPNLPVAIFWPIDCCT
jgi:hypothetical protein